MIWLTWRQLGTQGLTAAVALPAFAAVLAAIELYLTQPGLRAPDGMRSIGGSGDWSWFPGYRERPGRGGGGRPPVGGSRLSRRRARHTMNDDNRQSRWCVPRRAAIVAAAASLAVLVAACGSSSPPRRSDAAYSACMRKQGVTGVFAAPPRTSAPTSSSLKPVRIPAKAAAAMQACGPLLPRGKVSGLQVP